MSTKTASKSYEHRGRHNPVRNPGPPCRKAHAKLSARIADYARMMDDKLGNASKAPFGAFHKPGSMQR